jgi:hypothetical protein
MKARADKVCDVEKRRFSAALGSGSWAFARTLPQPNALSRRQKNRRALCDHQGMLVMR